MMNEDTSPYDANELARAKAALSWEMSKDTFKFLNKRMAAFAKTHSQFSENLWEGPEGRMEHIKSSFPMPSKVDEESDPLIGASNLSPKSNLAQEKAQENDLTLLPCQDNRSDPPSHSESVQKEQLKSSPSCSRFPQITSEEDLDVEIHSHLDNSEPSSKSSDFQAISSNQCNQMYQDDSKVEFSSASKAEQKHWTKLSNIQRKIQFAQKDLEAIRPYFKNSDHEKASKEMETLHWTIQGLITSLTEEKKSRDKNNFRLIYNQKPTEGEKSNSSKIYPQSYTETWLSLKHLCSKFKNMWRLNESVLSQFNSLEEISKAKLQSRLKKIAVNHSKCTGSM